MFLLLLICNILAALASVSGALLLPIASARTVGLQYFLHTLYFIFHPSLSICFALYIMNLNGTTLGRNHIFFWLFVLPYLCSELLVLTNPLTGLAFYMDAQFLYHRGPMMPVLYAAGAIYIIAGVAFFLRYKQAISPPDALTLEMVILLSVLGVALQAVFPMLQVELFAEALTFLTIMILLESRAGDIDQVTGTCNRRAFARTNRRLMETGQDYSILLLRMNNLDLFNRLFTGRDVDRFLCDVAGWLEALVPWENIYRTGYADFALILYGTSDAEVNTLADRVLTRFEQAWKSADIAAQLEAVVSVIQVPEDVQTLEQLDHLVAAGYRESGRGCLLVTRDELGMLKRNLAVEQALRHALQTGTLQVWYQPIWSAEAERTVAAEALVRLVDQELGLVSPEEFIPIAERSGLIQELGRHVFQEVCRFTGSHALLEHGLEYIEVNLSVYQFMHDDLVENFDRIRDSFGVQARQINLEITESVSDDAVPSVGDAIRQMTREGYSFSLDDYGTGYSNLGRLIRSEYRNVKIDKSILWDAEKNEGTALLLDNLIRVVRSLGMNVIQEGVETEAQLARVVGSGCNLIQGYYFSRPLTEQDFLSYLGVAAK